MAENDKTLLQLVKDLGRAIEIKQPSSKLVNVMKEISDHQLDQSPEILDFISRSDWNFIRLLHSVISNSKTEKPAKILAIQLLLSFGNQFPPLWTALAKENSLTQWVYNDMQADDDEYIYYALVFFTHLLRFPLPPEKKNKLGYNLVDYLLDLVTLRDEEGDQISAQALEALLRVSEQFEGYSFTENRVLEQLYDHKEQSELGQRFISYLNRANQEELYYISRLIFSILSNQAMAESFFYTNDLKVLADVIIRELNDLPAVEIDEHRRLLLMILEPYLKNTKFRTTLYRYEDLCKALQQFENYLDKTVKETAQRLLTLINDFKVIKKYQQILSTEAMG